MDPEEFLDFAEDERQANELWRKHQAQNQDAWQSVSALAAFLRTLAAAFEQRPDLLADIQVRESPWRYLPEYYGGSGLRNDLRDLLRMVEWGEQQGLKRVRLMLM
jgi:hypothetical protein